MNKLVFLLLLLMATSAFGQRGRYDFQTYLTTAATRADLSLDTDDVVQFGGIGSTFPATATIGAVVPNYFFAGTGGANSTQALGRFSNNGGGPSQYWVKSRATTPGSFTIIQDDDQGGAIIWFVDDGVDYNSSLAKITVEVDGTPGAGDTPGRMEFHTTADGAGGPTQRMTILESGFVGIGDATPEGLLSIVSTATATDVVTIDGTQTTGILLDIYSNSSNTGGLLRIRADGAGSTGTVLSLRQDGTGDFLNLFDGDGTTEVVTIEDGGLIGLNNSNPAVTLDVTGVVRVIAGTFGDTDVTPSIAGSNTFLTVSNTGATAITDLDGGNTAQRVLIICNNATNPPTIADSGNFTLSAAWAPGIGDTIELYVRADNDYVEISRSDN